MTSLFRSVILSCSEALHARSALLFIVAPIVAMCISSRVFAQDPHITEFPSALLYPYAITTGPDGNLWYTTLEQQGVVAAISRSGANQGVFQCPAGEGGPSGLNAITKGPMNTIWFTARGSATSLGALCGGPAGGPFLAYQPPFLIAFDPTGITIGSDQNLWVIGLGRDSFPSLGTFIWRFVPATGVWTPFQVPNPNPPGTNPFITATPDGYLWFTLSAGEVGSTAYVGRISTSGLLAPLSPVPTSSVQLYQIAPGPPGDNGVWFTETRRDEASTSTLGRIDRSSLVVQEVPPAANLIQDRDGIALGPDGNLWFHAAPPSAIVRMKPDLTGTIVSSYLTRPDAFGGSFDSITEGPDGNMWFTHLGTATIGRVCVPPTAEASASLSALCGSGTSSLTGSGGVSCAWAPSTGLANPTSCTTTASPPTTTTYSLTVTDANGCTSSNTASVTISVGVPPAAPTITAPSTVSAGQSFLTASVVNHPGSHYTWTIPNGNGTITSGQGTNAITFTAGAPGSLVLDVVEVNSAGCASTHSAFNVAVSGTCSAPLPPQSPAITPIGNPAGPVTGIDFLNVSWSAPASGASPSGYQWAINGGTYSSVGPVLTAQARPVGNNNPITLHVKSGACSPLVLSAAADSPVYTPAAPGASFSVSVGSATSVTDTSSPQATAWLWLWGDGTSDTRQAPPPHTYPGAGAYTIVLIATNGAGSSSATHGVSFASSNLGSFAFTSRQFDSSNPERQHLDDVRITRGGSQRLLVTAAPSDEERIVYLRFIGDGGQVVEERRLSLAPHQSEGGYDLAAYGFAGTYSLELVSTGQFSSSLLARRPQPWKRVER